MADNERDIAWRHTETACHYMNSLALGDFNGILKVWFSNSLYRIFAWAWNVKLLADECHRTSLMRSQYRFRWWLGAVRQQAITWANVDPYLRCHMALLGHSELFLAYPITETTTTPLTRTWMKTTSKFWQNFKRILFQRVLLISQYWFQWWLGAQQAIMINSGPVHQHAYMIYIIGPPCVFQQTSMSTCSEKLCWSDNF